MEQLPVIWNHYSDQTLWRALQHSFGRSGWGCLASSNTECFLVCSSCCGPLALGRSSATLASCNTDSVRESDSQKVGICAVPSSNFPGPLPLFCHFWMSCGFHLTLNVFVLKDSFRSDVNTYLICCCLPPVTRSRHFNFGLQKQVLHFKISCKFL